MADKLLLAADAAYPFDYDLLPKGCGVVLGYVGQQGCTPNVWTVADVEAVRKSGRVWAPIHVPPQQALTEDMGKQAGNMMVTELGRYPLYGTEPVFLDIEHLSWAPHPAEAMKGVRAWQAVMHAHGWPQAYAYLPWAAEDGWGANWVTDRPTAIPAKYVGWQYAGNAGGGKYDLSVFRPSVFQPLINSAKGNDVALTADDKAWMVAQLNKVQHNIGLRVSAYQWDNDKANPEPHANKHLHELLTELLAAVKAKPATSVDAKAVAAAITAQLGPTLAGQVAVELSKRLAK